MWVLTENGRLINLDHFYAVDVQATHQVVARSVDIIGVSRAEVLCSCDNEEHGMEIVQDIANALENGVELYNLRSAKVYVYTCKVCYQRFEVPRRDDNVHFFRSKVVCPHCWTAVEDEEAGGAAQ